MFLVTIMKPLLFNFKHFYINKHKNGYINLKPKKQFTNSSHQFLINNITTENSIYCSITDQLLLIKQEKDLLFEKKYCESIYKYLLKEKTNLQKDWRIVPYYQGICLNFNIVNHSIVYTKFEKTIKLEEEIPLYFTKKIVKKMITIKLDNYPVIKTFFKNTLNYNNNLDDLTFETLHTTLNNMIFNSKTRLLKILLDIKSIPLYIKSKQMIDTIYVEANEDYKKCFIKVIWKDMSICLF